MKLHSINNKRPDFELIYHACKGVLLLKDQREHVSHVMVKYGVLLITDGRALVACNAGGVANGFYKLISVKRSHIVLDYRHGLKEVAGDGFNTMYPDVSTITDIRFPNIDTIDTPHSSHLCAYIAINTGVPLSDVYTRLASKMGACKVEFFKDNLNKPVKFICSDTGCFYVMPIKID